MVYGVEINFLKVTLILHPARSDFTIGLARGHKIRLVLNYQFRDEIPGSLV